jgi:tetratricopeptide (TPR) repeat protein/4-amino-4-deoxy-L-arabinose transferase-like glycosyltransferase
MGRSQRIEFRLQGNQRILAVVSIFAVSLLLRLLNLHAFKSNPTFEDLDLDARFYDLWAKEIAKGDLVGKEVFFMGPLYPYFLALIYKLLGPNLFAVRIIQSFLGSLTAVLAFSLATQCFDSLVGLITGFMVALYIPFIYYDNAILLPVLATLLNTVMLLCLCKGFKEGRRDLFLVAGLACGLSAAGNASVLAFLPFVLLIMLVLNKSWKTVLNHFLAFVLGVVLLVLPITIRNYCVGRDWVLLTSNAGLNFYIGNNEQSTGAYVKPEGMNIYTDPSGKLIAEKELGRKLKPSEVSAYWMRKSFQFIKAKPKMFLYNLARKFFFFWSVYEIPQLQHIDFDKQFSGVLRLPLPTFGIVCPLGLVGMGLAIRRKSPALFPIAFTLVYSLTIIMFFVVDRYRLPTMTALMVLAGFTLRSWIGWLLERNYKKLIKTVGAFVLIYVVVHINLFRINPLSGYAQSWYRLGVALESRGDLQTALKHYRKAVELDPKMKPVYVNIGIILSRMGRYKDARVELWKAIELDTTYAKAYYNLGLTYSEEALPDSALAMYEKALAIDSQYVLAKAAKASALYEMGRLSEAEKLLRELVPVDFEEKGLSAQVRFLLDQIPSRREWIESRKDESQILSDRNLLRGDNLLGIGLIDASRRAYEKAIEIDPRSAPSHIQLGMLDLSGGQIESAHSHFLEAIRLKPDVKGAHLGIAMVALRKGNPQLCYDELKKELSIDPLNPAVHLNLAFCYEKYLSDIESAINHLKRYVELTGGTPEVIDHLRDLERKVCQKE